MPRSIPFLLCLLLLFGVLPVNAGPSDSSIVVGEPKVYDPRTLEAMARDLDAQLRAIRAVDPAGVTGAISGLQGSQARSLETEVRLQPVATPALELTETAGEAGTLEASQRKTTQGAVAPGPPPLPEPGALTSADLQYGASTQDILAEQVNLSYQVYNLRMLLNRSITDRYYPESGARLQVVLGFQISLDPMKRHRGKAAVVEIEVRHAKAGTKRPSLVALMPMEKTYNAAAFSKKSNAFGGAAVVNVFTLGASLRSRSETFYLYRDADTYAFERQSRKGGKATTFGWQFRPVLDQPSVEPGMRQLFAVLALEAPDANAEDIEVTALTFWRPYDRRNRLARRSWWAKPEIIAAYENVEIAAPPTAELQEQLGPRVDRVEVTRWTEDELFVNIEGERFFPGTQARIGDLSFDATQGNVTSRSHRQMQLIAPLTKVLTSGAVLNGREYGAGVPLLDPRGVSAEGAGIRFTEARRKPGLKDELVDLEILLENRRDPSKDLELHGQDVYLRIGDHVAVLTPKRWTKTEHPAPPSDTTKAKAYRQVVEVPWDLVRTTTKLQLAIPFFGPEYQTGGTFYPPMGVDRLVVLEDNDLVRWGVVGFGFGSDKDPLPDIKVYAGRKYDSKNDLERKNNQLLSFAAPRAQLAKVEQVVISLPGHLQVLVLPAPSTKLPAAAPELTGAPPEVSAKSAPTVEFTGRHLHQVKKVRFLDTELPHNVTAGKLVVALSRKVTESPGNVTLLGFVNDSNFLELPLKVK